MAQFFGLGFAQVCACIAALTVVGIALSFSVTVAFVAGTGFVLKPTAPQARIWANAC